MQGINLVVPKEVSFNSAGGVEKLVLDNPTAHKLAVKIRTNHKTALHIHPTHDFIEPSSKKEVIVKLLQVHQGVKLQINYTKATQQMVAKNDSKLTNVDKKMIKKEITSINVNELPLNQNKLKQSVGSVGSSASIESDFMTVVPQKSESRQIQKKQSLNLQKKEPQNLIVVEQKLEQDEQQFEQKQKKLLKGINQIEANIVKKRESILKKREESESAIQSGSVLPPIAIPFVLIFAYLIGSLLKSLIF